MDSLDLILLAPDEYDLAALAESLKDDDKFFDEYLFEDSDGHLSIEALKLDSEENIQLLMKYVFGRDNHFTEIFHADYAKIFDLSENVSNLTTSEQLENWYQDWIVESKRENTMDEYGQILGLIGFVERHRNNKQLLMIVKEAQN